MKFLDKKNEKIDDLIKKLEEMLKKIKGPLFVDSVVEEIWIDPKKIEISNVAKLSYEDLLLRLEEIQTIMIENGLKEYLFKWKNKE